METEPSFVPHLRPELTQLFLANTAAVQKNNVETRGIDADSNDMYGSLMKCTENDPRKALFDSIPAF